MKDYPSEFEKYISLHRRLRTYFQLQRAKKETQRRIERSPENPAQTHFTEDGEWL